MSSPIREVNFTVGQDVEIVSSEEGFVGSYYKATIVSCLDDGQYVVEYKNLREDDDSRKPLTETKPPNEIRPKPPRANRHEFHYGQMIDVFDNDGWWVGKIVDKFPDLIHVWQYYVYFEISNEYIWYPIKKIRIHHDWVSGQWVRAPKINRREDY